MANNYTDTTDTDFKGENYNIDEGKKLSAEGMRAALHTKENVVNKKDTLSSSSTEYPSAKAVYDSLNEKDSGAVHKAGNETITGVKTFGAADLAAEPKLGVAKITDAANDGTKFATEAQVYKAAQAADILPKGTILAMNASSWINAGAAFQSKWHVCDGTGGTPNLTGRFLRGGTASDNPIGGADSQSFGIGTNNLPAHNHTFSGVTATGRLPCYGSLHYRDQGAYGRAPSGVFREGSVKNGYVVGFNKWFDEPGLEFSMTPQGSVTGGGSATPSQITIGTVPNYYTVIYIMKVV
ncbi:MAG: hypothetical protein LBJ25_05950 [Candidatus Margulisbacteria bacterium]|jgi:hypothetical protein|nr:hypothetical protein [Candidatus Margulisiibacteriota bacterium]